MIIAFCIFSNKDVCNYFWLGLIKLRFVYGSLWTHNNEITMVCRMSILTILQQDACHLQVYWTSNFSILNVFSYLKHLWHSKPFCPYAYTHTCEHIDKNNLKHLIKYNHCSSFGLFFFGGGGRLNIKLGVRFCILTVWFITFETPTFPNQNTFWLPQPNLNLPPVQNKSTTEQNRLKLSEHSTSRIKLPKKNYLKDCTKTPPEVWKTRQFSNILLRHCNAVYNQNIRQMDKGMPPPLP